jgi:putative transposase
MSHIEHNEMIKNWQADLLNNSDFLKKMVAAMLQNLLNTEFNNFIGAEKYERSETRAGMRNGSYERSVNTRVGNITLQVCRDRNGDFSPRLFERYERSEKSLVLAITEMYFFGVSTRKIEGITQELCGINISKSQVSELAKRVDEELNEWRNRMLTGTYEYMVLGARYEKVRENGHVISKAFVVVIGITSDGIREIIGCYIYK